MNPDNVTAHQRLGFLLFNVKHQFQEGLEHTAQALRLDPQNGFAQSDLGVALLSRNAPDKAIPHLQAALAALPFSREPQYQPQVVRVYLGKACLQCNRYTEAATNFQESIRLAPDNPEAHYLLALALACQGETDPAAGQVDQAVALKPQIDTSVVLHELLAENYARAGRLPEAIHSAEHALQIARAAGKNDLAERIAARLARYQATAARSR